MGDCLTPPTPLSSPGSVKAGHCLFESAFLQNLCIINFIT
jgi:hypothetical protein